ncbi:Hint domain-containing protein [Mesobacterium pallidum]|uniref:Hint domain-containing protein n=1 Tax=Mesobacterium pallidum TaxID=2872037 RepID=UPI001EE37770|nr:Hint domain-containing protein [Mesobacterium pallidum]
MAQAIPVYAADHIRVVNGANLGDPLGFADELMPDDVYALTPHATRAILSLEPVGDHYIVAAHSAAGVPGQSVFLDSTVTFMSGDGQTQEAIVLVAVDDTGCVAEAWALPLAPLYPDVDYVLVGCDRSTARQKFAQVACVSFTRGTHITLAGGAQRPIEELSVGDRVLTRDDGPQEVRWIGQATTRATGEFSPILIRAGALNNSRDLVVSPDHRLFIYQRRDTLGAGRSEVLVRARHLVNGRDVVQVEGGFVDYFQLLFDDHQIIYAEGIAAESLLVDTRTRQALPQDLAAGLSVHDGSLREAYDVQESLLRHPDTVDMLRRSTRG